jgi:DNA-binding response OmpR family regulator
MRVLVVEDNRELAGLLRKALAAEGYDVVVAYDGDAALREALASPFDLMVLDIGLPHRDGFALAKELRRRRSDLPVLMLTARDSLPDKLRGFESGADDYLTKPFAMEELLARVRALTRRQRSSQPSELLRVGDLVINPATYEAWVGDRFLELTAKEFAVLELFMRHPGQILTRATILDRVWDESFEGESNVVDVTIARLRRKMGDTEPASRIQTVRGLGYRLRSQPAPPPQEGGRAGGPAAAR